MRPAFRSVTLSVAAIGLLLVTGDRAPGFSYFVVGSQAVIWPSAQALRYLSPTAFPAGSAADVLIREAMGQWSSVPACDFQYFFSRPAQDFPVDHFDGFSDTVAVPPQELDPGIISVSFMVNNGAEWFDVDTVFNNFPLNTGWTFDPNPSCDLITAPVPANGFSFLLVALHEMGHTLGLGHDPLDGVPPGTPWRVATMNGVYPHGGPVGQENIIELHTDDRNGARFLYPHSGPSNPPVTDLANTSYIPGAVPGQFVPAPFDPPIVDLGDLLTVRGVIENFGTTSEFFVHHGFYLSADEQIDTSDTLIGETLWDLAFTDAFEFEAIMSVDADLAPGSYYVGSILDDLDDVLELHEDNNAASSCSVLLVRQLSPVIDALPQETAVAGEPYTGPTPTVTHPVNMGPITWSLDAPPPGMVIDPGAGVITWPDPIESPFLYAILFRATNGSGTGTQTLFLGVQEPPDPCPSDCGPGGGGDGVVDVVDLLSLLAEWGSGGPFDCDTAPAGGDGKVGVPDLLLLLSVWGPCP